MMKDFKKDLRVYRTSEVLDVEILEIIINELNQMQGTSDINEYRELIEYRKSKLTDFFSNFNENIRIIETISRFSQQNSTSIKYPNYATALDKIISRKIFLKLDLLYQNKLINFGNDKGTFQSISSQILDRQISIVNLFKDFEGNIKLIDHYKKLQEQRKQSSSTLENDQNSR